jgi:hypothetical protein
VEEGGTEATTGVKRAAAAAAAATAMEARALAKERR